MVKIVYGTTVSRDQSDIINMPDNKRMCYDFALKYDEDKEKYFMDIETMYGFDRNGGCREYIEEIFNRFTEFLKYNHIDTSCTLNAEQAFHEPFAFSKECDKIKDCYAIFKFYINGFTGNGLFCIT